MSFWRRLFESSPAEAKPHLPLYGAIVSRARDPRWYAQGGVPDTIDGRFDMLALVMTLVLLRLDREGAPLRATAVQLTERFIDDMDGQLRELGIGDVVVGKHMGKMMGALGGRIDAYGEALDKGGDLEAALIRNLYRGEAPSADGLALVAADVRALHRALGGQPVERLIAGELGG